MLHLIQHGYIAAQSRTQLFFKYAAVKRRADVQLR